VGGNPTQPEEVNLGQPRMIGGPVRVRAPKKAENGGKGKPAPRWCPSGITKTQRHRLQKMRQWEIVEKWMEEQWDAWFAQALPIAKPKKTWKEKCLAQEKNGTDSSLGQGEFEIGESSGTTKEDEAMVQPRLDVNMVFVVLEEFHVLETKVAELCTGVERAVFKKPPKLGENMKPLYIRGHLDGVPVGRMMVDGVRALT
jgi:hypothetical protein